jgi:dolichol-phosphate mannosyltransferase
MTNTMSNQESGSHLSLKPPLSILIPIYNERENIGAVIDEVILKVTPSHDLDLIIINDGSDDEVLPLLEEKAAEHRELRFISHPVKSGKSAALRTGMLMAQNTWVGTMDGDGQDDPQNLLNMATRVDLMTVGKVGLVAGNRTSRTDGQNRKWASRMANALRKSLLKDDCPDTACGLKLISRDLFLAMPFFDALHRYLPAFTSHLGFATINVPVTNRARYAGTSKYSNIGRAIAGLFDLAGVVWLLQRTHNPSVKLSLIPSQNHFAPKIVKEEMSDASDNNAPLHLLPQNPQ